METQKGPYKDYSPSKMGPFWVSMLVSGSVAFFGQFLEVWDFYFVLGLRSRYCRRKMLCKNILGQSPL